MRHDTRLRIVPLVVACPLFLQNLDTSVMATALPSMAHALRVPVLDLNLAVTAYLLSLAVFLPASAWLADRFGAKRVFCAAILVFSLGSALCGMAGTVGQLVACRLLQGAGGAMMVPVGRTILLRSVASGDLVRAMIWFTVPGAVGRLAGPFFGGAIVTVASWHWIFLVNIPFGLLGVALAAWLIDADPPAVGTAAPFDYLGLGLLALGLVGLLGGVEMMGKPQLPPLAAGCLMCAGLLALAAYARHGLALPNAILDLRVLRFPTFRIATVGSFPLKLAVGAAPFLLPLLLQLGFGLPPLESGLITMGMAVGSLATRTQIERILQAFGPRHLLVGAASLTALVYLGYGLLTAHTPRPLVFGLLLCGGLFTSMTLVTLNTIGYADIPNDRTSHASTVSAMTHQLTTALGVLLGATVVAIAGFLQRGSGAQPAAADFPPAFAVMSLLALASAFAFRRLDRQAN